LLPDNILRKSSFDSEIYSISSKQNPYTNSQTNKEAWRPLVEITSCTRLPRKVGKQAKSSFSNLQCPRIELLHLNFLSKLTSENWELPLRKHIRELFCSSVSLKMFTIPRGKKRSLIVYKFGLSSHLPRPPTPPPLTQ